MSLLTELVLELKQPVVTFGEVLVSCPKLTDLSYKYQSDQPWPRLRSDIRLPSILKLESLAIYNTQVDQGDLQEVLTKCPGMQKLYIRRSDFRLLETINVSCPRVKVLAINNSQESRLPSYLFKNASEDVDGLQELVIGPYDNTDLQQRQIIPLLTKSTDTLRSLVIALHFQYPMTSLLQLGLFGGARLTTICLTGFPRGSQGIFTSIFRQCQALVSVSIAESDILSDSVIFDGLCTLNKLETIELSERLCAVHHNGARRFFEQHVGLGAKSSLRVVKLVQLAGVGDTILSAIGKISSLETLTLHRCDNITREGLEQCIKDLSSSKLSTISLVWLPALTDQAVEELGNISSLAHVSLWCSNDITDDGIGKLVDKAPSLKKLAIHQCPNVTNDMREYVTNVRNIELHPEVK